MLRVSELPVARWPPGAGVDLHRPAADEISSLYIDIYGSRLRHKAAAEPRLVDL